MTVPQNALRAEGAGGMEAMGSVPCVPSGRHRDLMIRTRASARLRRAPTLAIAVPPFRRDAERPRLPRFWTIRGHSPILAALYAGKSVNVPRQSNPNQLIMHFFVHLRVFVVEIAFLLGVGCDRAAKIRGRGVALLIRILVLIYLSAA